jgi:hypothetical protein
VRTTPDIQSFQSAFTQSLCLGTASAIPVSKPRPVSVSVTHSPPWSRRSSQTSNPVFKESGSPPSLHTTATSTISIEELQSIRRFSRDYHPHFSLHAPDSLTAVEGHTQPPRLATPHSLRSTRVTMTTLKPQLIRAGMPYQFQPQARVLCIS